jgi:hypothetical protein
MYAECSDFSRDAKEHACAAVAVMDKAESLTD